MHLIIRKPGKDPFFNLASEEYFFRKYDRPVFSIWQNKEAIIVGKHQNAYREINYPWIRSQQIPVIRRITGGGTVYHGPGNINFSFIFKGDPDNLVDFRSFTKPVVEFLDQLRIPAEFRPKSNIEVNGVKVSGNSAHLYRNKLLYHGTLLFNADLERLRLSTMKNGNTYTDKAVDSVPARVANLRPMMSDRLDEEEFIQAFTEFIFRQYPDSEYYHASKEDDEAIRELVANKYSQWEWNFGYSPRYRFSRKFNFRKRLYQLDMEVEKGEINTIAVEGTVDTADFRKKLSSLLPGCRHDWDSIRSRLLAGFEPRLNDEELNQLLTWMF